MNLPKVPDRSKIYYKITNRFEKHNSLQYHDGLVVDNKRFNDNPKHSCVIGGIYFTTKKYLHRFFGFGKWIRPVTITKDAKVLLDPEGDKYRADRLFFHPRKSMEFYFTDLFDKKIFPKESYWRLAEFCPKYFNIWFDKKTFSEESYWYLAIHYSEHFDKWFDKKTFPRESYYHLTKHCSEYFDKWFDKKTFPEKYYWYIETYCSKQLKKIGKEVYDEIIGNIQ